MKRLIAAAAFLLWRALAWTFRVRLAALTVAQEGRNRPRSGAGAGIALGGTDGEIGAHRGTQP